MDTNERNEDELRQCIEDLCLAFLRIFIVLFCAMIFCVMCSACKSHQQLATATTAHDTLYQNVIRHDSVYLHDSIFQEILRQGDTVTVTKYIAHTAYRDRLLHDTIYKSKTDTITTTTTKEVPAATTAWQRFLLWMGRFSICAVLSVIIYVAYRIYRKYW